MSTRESHGQFRNCINTAHEIIHACQFHDWRTRKVMSLEQETFSAAVISGKPIRGFLVTVFTALMRAFRRVIK